ncbi:MAG: hypothetical protein ACMXYD_03210 [Candidatus Woesearchaeota archaeon]
MVQLHLLGNPGDILSMPETKHVLSKHSVDAQESYTYKQDVVDALGSHRRVRTVALARFFKKSDE